EMEQDEALHLEIHVRIEGESQAVKDAGARRLQVTIFDGEAIFHDLGGDPNPDIHQGLRGHRAHQTMADQFMPGDLPRALLSADSFGSHDKADPTHWNALQQGWIQCLSVCSRQILAKPLVRPHYSQLART